MGDGDHSCGTWYDDDGVGTSGCHLGAQCDLTSVDTHLDRSSCALPLCDSRDAPCDHDQAIHPHSKPELSVLSPCPIDLSAPRWLLPCTRMCIRVCIECSCSLWVYRCEDGLTRSTLQSTSITLHPRHMRSTPSIMRPTLTPSSVQPSSSPVTCSPSSVPPSFHQFIPSRAFNPPQSRLNPIMCIQPCLQ
eukprot:scaffold33069_cov43-Tisochrysis_lutea.AAC.2